MGLPGSQSCSLDVTMTSEIFLSGGSCLMPWKDLEEPQSLEDSELFETVILYVEALYCCFKALMENETA